MLSRRSFFTGATAIIITAPAIVRGASIMSVKPVTFWVEPKWLRIRLPTGRIILADGDSTVIKSPRALEIGKPLSEEARAEINALFRIVG